LLSKGGRKSQEDEKGGVASHKGGRGRSTNYKGSSLLKGRRDGNTPEKKRKGLLRLKRGRDLRRPGSRSVSHLLMEGKEI